MLNNAIYYTRTGCLLVWFSFNFGCKKILNVSPPVNTVSTAEVFSNDNQATEALAGMYSSMTNNSASFTTGAITTYCGMSADELIASDQAFIDGPAQFQQNNLLQANSIISNNFWSSAYSTIYSANSLIAGLSNAPNVHDSVKNEIIGEAEIVRAFCDFYLINLFGEIPFVTSINWQKTNLLPRADTGLIYSAIITNLLDAQSRTANDYSIGNGQRIFANRWAATALLARVYLYRQNWDSAILESSQVINNSNLYSLTSNLNGIFLINSSEAIWQLQQPNKGLNYNATPDGARFIPAVLNSFIPPFAYLSTQLLNSFEEGDKRKLSWIDSTVVGVNKYYFPYKYKIGLGQATPGGAWTEYYMVLRLTEQYLIRAEAEANIGQLNSAISDLDVIRARAGLGTLPPPDNQGQVLNEVVQERRVELFAEWGNRWLDLKRTGMATSVLSLEKGISVSQNALVYPIPVADLSIDPNLGQNPGY